MESAINISNIWREVNYLRSRLGYIAKRVQNDTGLAQEVATLRRKVNLAAGKLKRFQAVAS